MESTSVRRALYVLFARLLAGGLDAELYRHVRSGGLDDLAQAQAVDLFSDLLDADDPESAAVELGAEYARLSDVVSLRASEYSGTTEDSVIALDAFLREHELAVGEHVDLPHDHIALILGVMGELAQREGSGADEDAPAHARAFFLRHILPWVPAVLAEVSSQADRRFYRGLAVMLSAFLATERQHYQDA